MLATERLCQEVPAWTGQLATLLESADPARRCRRAPEWTLVELSRHVGYAFRWMTTIVATRATAPVRRRDTRAGGRRTTRRSCRPGCGRARPSWSARSARSARRPRVWTWAAAGPRPEWWLQRMLYELVVHVADEALALGEPVTIS
jgi:hypothetical protein